MLKRQIIKIWGFQCQVSLQRICSLLISMVFGACQVRGLICGPDCLRVAAILSRPNMTIWGRLGWSSKMIKRSRSIKIHQLSSYFGDGWHLYYLWPFTLIFCRLLYYKPTHNPNHESFYTIVTIAFHSYMLEAFISHVLEANHLPSSGPNWGVVTWAGAEAWWLQAGRQRASPQLGSDGSTVEPVRCWWCLVVVNDDSRWWWLSIMVKRGW